MYLSRNRDKITVPNAKPGYSGLFFDIDGTLWQVDENGNKQAVAPSKYLQIEKDTTLSSLEIGKGVAIYNNGKAGSYTTDNLFLGTLINIISNVAIVDCNQFQIIKLDTTLSNPSFLNQQTYIVYVNILNGGKVVLSDTSDTNTIGMYIYNTFNSNDNTIKFKLFSSSDLIFIERNVNVVGIFNQNL